MEPLSLAIAAAVVGLCTVFGLSLLWWAVKTAVRGVVKLVVLAVAGVIMLAAVAVAAVTVLVVVS